MKATVKKAHRAHLSLLRDALGRQAYSALTASPGARAYHDQLRAARSSTTKPPPGTSTAADTAPPQLDIPNPWDASQRYGPAHCHPGQIRNVYQKSQ